MLSQGSSRQQIAIRYGLRNFASAKKQKVVVLGSGWAGYRFLQDCDHEQYEINVVSPRNHMLFTPLLSSAAVGTVEIRSVCEPVRPLTIKKEGRFYQGGCYAIDIQNKIVHCTTALSHTLERKQFVVPYDKLVIACGMTVNDFGIEGVKEHACYMKETSDARKVRKRMITRLEEASHPSVDINTIRDKLTFVVVGGGPTGVEFAAELADFLEQDCRKQYPEVYAHATVILVEGNELLSMFNKRLRDYALKKMRKRKVDVRLGRQVVKVDAKHIHLSDDTTTSYGLLVWSGGVRSHQFIRDLDFPHNGRGQILTNEYMEVKGAVNGSLNDVFCIGDCAEMEDYPLPPTAAVATSQAKFVAKYFNSGFDKEKVAPYKYKGMGQMAWVGDWSAAVDLGPEKARVPFSGFLAAMTWRMAYFSMQGSMRNRFMVPFDWFKSFVFGRDLTRF